MSDFFKIKIARSRFLVSNVLKIAWEQEGARCKGQGVRGRRVTRGNRPMSFRKDDVS